MRLPFVPLLVLALHLAHTFTPAQAAQAILKKAAFCRGFEDNNAPKDVTDFFLEDETINLSIELEGRPKSGVVAAKFMFRDHMVTEVTLDVATVNKGVIFSFGQNTFVRFEITHKKPLPVGACYTAEVTFDGQPLGKFPFRIAPPEGSLPSKLLSVNLAKGTAKSHESVDDAHVFDSTDQVCLVGVADLGLSSWLEATWKVGGKVDEEGSRTLDIKENKANVPLVFSFLPAGGWPAGLHEVSLQLDGQEVAKKKFTVKAGSPSAPLEEPGIEVAQLSMKGGKSGTLAIQSARLFKDDGKGEAGKEVKSFTTQDTELHAQWTLKEKALAKGIQLAWVLVESEGEEEQVLVTVDVEEALSDEITSSLTAKKGLPPGKYRIDLLQDGNVLDSKPFQVK